MCLRRFRENHYFLLILHFPTWNCKEWVSDDIRAATIQAILNCVVILKLKNMTFQVIRVVLRTSDAMLQRNLAGINMVRFLNEYNAKYIKWQ